MKKNYFKFFGLFVSLIFYIADVNANCANFTFNVTSIASDCQASGAVVFSVSPNIQTYIRMDDAEYSIASTIPGGFSYPFGHINDGTIRNVPPGTYTAKMRAFCIATSQWEVSSYEDLIIVEGNYEIPEAFIVTGNIRKSLNCINSGMFPVSIRKGKAPYTVTIVSSPDEYTGSDSFVLNNEGIINIEDLAPGEYKVRVTDQCTYDIPLSVTIETVSVDFPSSSYYSYLYAPTDNSCNKVMVGGRSSLSTSNDLYYYWSVYYARYYEVKFSFNGTDLTEWISPTTSYTTFTLPDGYTLTTMREQNKYITVYLRLKGTDCVSSGTNIQLYNYHASYGTTYYCDNFTRHFYMYGQQSVYGTLCYPVNYEVRKGSCSGELITSGTIATRPASSQTITVPGLEYGNYYYFCYTDASGYSNSSSTYASYTTPSVSSTTTSCMAYIGKGYVYVYNVNKAQKIELISTPEGAPAVSPVYNSNNYYYYPYGSSYTDLPAGTYSFQITDSCGNTYIRNTTLYYYKVNSFTYTVEESCDGLKVFPSGSYTYGSTQYVNPYYRIYSSPSGVNLGNPVIRNGGYFLFPSSGRYIIQMQDGSGTSTCAMDTIIIDYEKKTVALDAQKTSSYVCVGESVGHIGLVAKDGSGNYHYEIPGSGLPSNNTGEFTYGAPGITYTIKVTDAECNVSFEQDVTMADLNTARIVYMDKTDGQYCYGESIGLNCLTLGNTDYSWVGPNGFTSDQQNPVITNAAPGDIGTYTVTVQPEHCGNPLSQSLDVNVSGFTNIYLDDDDVKICEGESFTLNLQVDQEPHSYNWLHNSNLRATTSDGKFTVSPASIADRGEYKVLLVNEYNCKDSAVSNVRVFPMITTWTAENSSSEWNDDLNWDRGAPGSCTYAIIPGGEDYYPFLDESSSIAFECDTIEFMSGGEVARTDLLVYNGAKVNLEITSNRWYMISPPLRDIYSGDYYIGSPDERYNPPVYIMKYQSVNPQTGRQAVAGDWSQTFNTLNERLVTGLGYTIWTYRDNDSDLNLFNFPKKDMQYTYYYENGASGGTATIPSRTYKNKFIYESSYPFNGVFTVPVESDLAGAQTTIIGNPFMSHLDFYKFYEANQSKIENKYYIWTGGGFDASTLTASGILSTDTHNERFIPPMQSIILTKKDPSGLVGNLTFSFDMSVTSANNDLKINKIEDMFRIELNKGEYSSRIAIAYDPHVSNKYNPAKDIYTLFPPDDENVMILYAMLGTKAASIRTIGDLSEHFELAVRSRMTGDFTLKAIIPDHLFPDKTVYLIDNLYMTVTDLRKYPVYPFQKNSEEDLETRFFIKIADVNTEIDDIQEDQNILVYTNKGQLFVSCISGDPITDIEIMSVNGSIISRHHGLNSDFISLPLPPNRQVLIVKAITQNNSKISKIRVE